MAPLGGHMFYIGLNRENVKKSPCLKPQGLKPWYLVCSITKGTSTKFVHIIPHGPEIAPPRGPNVLHRLYIEKCEKNLLV